MLQQDRKDIGSKIRTALLVVLVMGFIALVGYTMDKVGLSPHEPMYEGSAPSAMWLATSSALSTT